MIPFDLNVFQEYCEEVNIFSRRACYIGLQFVRGSVKVKKLFSCCPLVVVILSVSTESNYPK